MFPVPFTPSLQKKFEIQTIFLSLLDLGSQTGNQFDIEEMSVYQDNIRSVLKELSHVFKTFWLDTSLHCTDDGENC